MELRAGSSSNIDQYLTRLARHLSRHRDYPRRAQRLNMEGTPVVLFRFNRQGELLDYSLSEGSSHNLLDEAALEMLVAAAPLPAVPDDMQGETFSFQLPVRFNLR